MTEPAPDPNICSRCSQPMDKHIGTTRQCPVTPDTADLLFRPKPIPVMCTHHFIAIQQKEKFAAATTRIEKVGMQCGCIHCGEVRTVWDNGEIEINHRPHDHRPNTTTKDNGKHPLDHQVD